MSTSAVECRASFADNFRLVHDITSLSDDDVDEEANCSPSLRSTINQTKPVNYLENTFSINLKNATNLLHCTGPVLLSDSHPSMRTTGLNVLRIEDVGKLQGALPDPECSLKKSLEERHQHVWSTDYKHVSAIELKQDKDAEQELVEFTNGNTEIRSYDTSGQSSSNSSSNSSSPTTSHLHPKDTKREKKEDVTLHHSGNVKRRRRPRKLPEIPTQRRRDVKSLPPLSVLVNFQSLADELTEADPTDSHPSLDKGPKTRSRSVCASAIDWRDLGSPEHIENDVFKFPLDRELMRQDYECNNTGSDSEAGNVIPTATTATSSSTPHCMYRPTQQTHEPEQKHSQSTDYISQPTLYPESQQKPKYGCTSVPYVSQPHIISTPNKPKPQQTGITPRKEFCERVEYIDDDLRLAGKTLLDFKIDVNSNNSLNTLEKNSDESESVKDLDVVFSESQALSSIVTGRERPPSTNYSGDLEELEATHRGCHKFIPRHPDELFIEIGDPIYVEVESDDLWCEGVNLRTGKKGSFPAVYATDLEFLDSEDGSRRLRKFTLQFLGSVEVSQHKGTEALSQAIHKVAASRKLTMNTQPPPTVSLEINEHGIKITENEKRKEEIPEKKLIEMSVKERLAHIINKGKEAQNRCDHFFNLKNVAYCGYHPRNEKYFAFITKHPLDLRFACHVLLGQKSTKSLSDAVGTAFRKFYQEYMAFVHPTEDIYLE